MAADRTACWVIGGIAAASMTYGNGFVTILDALPGLPPATSRRWRHSPLAVHAVGDADLHHRRGERDLFGTPTRTSARYDEGADWVGVRPRRYNGVAARSAFGIRRWREWISPGRADIIWTLHRGSLGSSPSSLRDRAGCTARRSASARLGRRPAMPSGILTRSPPPWKLRLSMGRPPFLLGVPRILAAALTRLHHRPVLQGPRELALLLGGFTVLLATALGITVQDDERQDRSGHEGHVAVRAPGVACGWRPRSVHAASSAPPVRPSDFCNAATIYFSSPIASRTAILPRVPRWPTARRHGVTGAWKPRLGQPCCDGRGGLVRPSRRDGDMVHADRRAGARRRGRGRREDAGHRGDWTRGRTTIHPALGTVDDRGRWSQATHRRRDRVLIEGGTVEAVQRVPPADSRGPSENTSPTGAARVCWGRAGDYWIDVKSAFLGADADMVEIWLLRPATTAFPSFHCRYPVCLSTCTTGRTSSIRAFAFTGIDWGVLD